MNQRQEKLNGIVFRCFELTWQILYTSLSYVACVYLTAQSLQACTHTDLWLHVQVGLGMLLRAQCAATPHRYVAQPVPL